MSGTNSRNRLAIYSLTHQTTSLENIGCFQLPHDSRIQLLSDLKFAVGAQELLYLATCNRVEILLVFSENHPLPSKLDLFAPLYNGNIEDLRNLEASIGLKVDLEAVSYFMRVTTSLESMLIGEQEVITQVRKAFEECRENGLTGDWIRLLMRKNIETAKACFSYSKISERPVSIAFLAWQHVADLNSDTRFLLIGAGQMINTFSRFLKKSGKNEVTIANRTITNAETIAQTVNGRAIDLKELQYLKGGFDVVVTCTSAQKPIVTGELFDRISENRKTIIIDLAIPADVEQAVQMHENVTYVGMETLQNIAQSNIELRKGEIEKIEKRIAVAVMEFDQMLKERAVEKAMSEIPRQVKAIRQTAMDEVFAKELAELDMNSRETLHKVMAYMEKKYISVPMKLAKSVMMENHQINK